MPVFRLSAAREPSSTPKRNSRPELAPPIHRSIPSSRNVEFLEELLKYCRGWVLKGSRFIYFWEQVTGVTGFRAEEWTLFFLCVTYGLVRKERFRRWLLMSYIFRSGLYLNNRQHIRHYLVFISEAYHKLWRLSKVEGVKRLKTVCRHFCVAF